jgi:transposase
MPERSDTRAQLFLLPPSLDDYVGPDDPVRYVAAFVEQLSDQDWRDLGVEPAQAFGAPRYAPGVLLRVWLSGFVLGIRSARGLERGCRQRFDLCWAAAGQQPDHNTLWRFYQRSRGQMRQLLHRTIRTAVAIGLIDLAVQAVDGTKVLADANPDAGMSAEQLVLLAEQVEQAIADLEAQNQGDGPPPPELPPELQDARVLRDRIAAVQQRQAAVDADEPAPTLNRTDPQARTMKTRQGLRLAYNAQLVVTPTVAAVGGGAGRIVLAAAVTVQANDVGLLAPMAQAARVAGQPIPMTLADAGYSSGASLLAADAAGVPVIAPVQRQRQQHEPYAKERFHYDPDADVYRCPEEQVLTRRGRTRVGGVPAVRYRADAQVCAACPVRPLCTRSPDGRQLKITDHDARLRQQQAVMATETARRASAQRKGLIEPVFGILKDRMGARRTLLRGRGKVEAEWVLTATAFNLRTLARAAALGTPLARAA